jgi:hypothetical protein
MNGEKTSPRVQMTFERHLGHFRCFFVVFLAQWMVVRITTAKKTMIN